VQIGCRCADLYLGADSEVETRIEKANPTDTDRLKRSGLRMPDLLLECWARAQERPFCRIVVVHALSPCARHIAASIPLCRI
jgi:hypothetical protein